jgi:hypothetical protein
MAVMPTTALDLDKGLVAYYSFDNIEGNILKDDSGNGHDGIIHGNPKVVDGIKGKALEFDGVDDYIRIPNSNVLSNIKAVTVSFWIKVYNINDQFFYTHKDDQIDSHPTGHEIIIWKGNVGFWLLLDGNWYDAKVSANDYLSVGKWYMLTGVYCGNYIKFYINGNLVAITSIPNNKDFYRIDGDLCIGKNDFLPTNNPSSYPTRGIIDELRIYNRALSEEEIKALYEQTLHPTPTQPPTPKPKLELTINCDSLLKQGEIRTAELMIENVGNANAKDITVTVISTSLGINVQKSYDLIPPKEARTISFKVSPNEAGKFTIKARVEYWDDKENKYIETTEKTITVESTEIVTPITTQKTPGYTALLTVVIIATITFIRLTRR